MPRPTSHRLVLGSVSALAMVTMLAACSQPASYATVDLSGSYGQSSQTAQAYSPVTGQPVYQSVSLYGPQSFPDAAEYAPSAQYAAVDAPTDQVASLGYEGGGFDTFGIGSQPAIPQYSPVASSPAFQEAELLASPQFTAEIESVDRAFIDTGPLDAPAPAPFAQPAPVEEMIETVEAVPVYDTAVPTPLAQSDSWETPKSSAIEEAALAPLAPPPARELPKVGSDYETIDETNARPAAPLRDEAYLPNAGSGAPYEPWVAPVFGSEEAEEDAPVQQAQRPAPWRQQQITQSPLRPLQPYAPPAAPQNQPRQGAGPDSAFANAARDLIQPQQPIQARIPAPSSVPPVVPTLQIGGGMRVPKASTEYPRPYDLLRPGVWPELQNPGEGLVQAPTETPIPQFAQLVVPEADSEQQIARASERKNSDYEIQRGDTLLTIAEKVGTTPMELAFENGMTPEAAIYIGQKLILPAAPARVAYTEEGIPTIEVVSADDPSDIGGPSVPKIDVATVEAVTGRAPIQRASIPIRRVTTMGDAVAAETLKVLSEDNVVSASPAPAKFAWPVHGEVYRLESGPVEIDAEGNAPVSASAPGRVAHVERGPMGVLVVIEHDNGWRSLTVGLDYSAVRPGDTVEQGGVIGKASRDHRVRFELRDADASVTDALAQLRG